MRIPTIHLNGTSKDALLSQLETAHSALQDALCALSKASPNARDYYVQGNDAFGEAQNEHRQRLEKVAGVAREIESIYNRLYETD